jgi:hypothetical protein
MNFAHFQHLFHYGITNEVRFLDSFFAIPTIDWHDGDRTVSTRLASRNLANDCFMR